MPMARLGMIAEEGAVVGNQWEIETNAGFVRDRLAGEAATERLLAEAERVEAEERPAAGLVRRRVGWGLIALGRRVAGTRELPAAWGGAAWPPRVGPAA